MVARFRYSDLKGAVCGCGRRGRYANSNGRRMGLRRGEGRPASTAHDTVRAEIGCSDRVSQRNVIETAARKKSVSRRGRAIRSAPDAQSFSGCREWFHAAAEITGGERSWISAAVSRSTIFIGPPQMGQR